MLKWRSYLLIFVSIYLIQCNLLEENTLFRKLSPKDSGIQFLNKIDHEPGFSILDYMYYYNGGGVAIGDINNDGLEDLYFSGNQISSKLYLNLGQMKFQDITEMAGVKTNYWSSGVTMIDINQDSWLDIYVCRTGRPDSARRANLLFINNQDNTFSESAEKYGLASNSYSTQAAFFDYDLDGDLDVYLLNHMQQFKGTNNPYPKKVNGESRSTDQLLRNEIKEDGTRWFKDVSREAGILIEGFGLGIGISDLNKDGWPDIYVSNDFVSNDILYINNQDGTFTDKISSSLKHQSHNGMGNDLSDFNNDTWTDIFVADMLPESNHRRKQMVMNINYDLFQTNLRMGYDPQYPRNTLQLNNGMILDDKEPKHVNFSEIGQLSGVHATDWSWSSLFADVDNDGWKDLFISNGHLKDLTNKDFIAYRKKRMLFNTQKGNDSLYLDLIKDLPAIEVPNYIFRNNRDLTFANKGKVWLGNVPTMSNGSAIGDLDNDGDLDLVTNNLNSTSAVFVNQLNSLDSQRYLQIILKTNLPHTTAIGSKLTLYTGEETQYLEYFFTKGYLSSMGQVVHFGLGSNLLVDSLIIEWPDHQIQKLTQLPSNKRMIVEKDSKKVKKPKTFPVQPIFTNVTDSLGIEHIHYENYFVDFKVERLLTHKYSTNGPGIAVGDINGDGHEDFFVGGARGYPGVFFIQKGNRFYKQPLEADQEYEDMGSVLFDFDQDGDLDLYVVSGGGSYWSEPKMFQDRIYLNQKGHFVRADSVLPKILESGSCVLPIDYDQDGDTDLFVGGRVMPGRYPETPASYILQNLNGKFVDATDKVAPFLKHIGMVTAALWTDYDNDGLNDLFVVGEWMEVTIFRNMGGSFERVNCSFTNVNGDTLNTSGWWNSAVGGDFDNDGDTDYAVGNLGLNHALHSSQSYPIAIHYGYLDHNKSWESLVSQYALDAHGKYNQVPLASRDVLLDQMNILQKKYLNYKRYGSATINEILDFTKSVEVAQLNASMLQSVLLINEGENNFIAKPLPMEAQFSAIYGMLACDVDNDEWLDILVGGNFYGPNVEIGRMDGSNGLVLRGQGDGFFIPLRQSESGFYADQEVRDITTINVNNQIHYIVSRSNGPLSIFRKRKKIPEKTY